MQHIHQRRSRSQSDLRRYWKVMSLSERFEQTIAAILGMIIAVVILLALWELIRLVVSTILLQQENILVHSVFQKLFGAILTLLIAMEFQHSIIKVIERREHIIQTKIVMLIALLALARKFIIIDTNATSPQMIVALAFAVLALGGVYWLIEQRDVARRDQEAETEIARAAPPTRDEPGPSSHGPPN